jgi:biopolymer transport protein ExbD
MGKVKRRRRKQRIREGAGEIPTSSFADIAFLLIIYFIVVTVLIKTQGLVTEMPTGQKVESADMEKVPIVNVADEQILFNDTRTSVQGLREKLTEMALPEKQPSDRVIMLEVSGRQTYQLFYEVIAVIQKAGGVIAMVEEAKEDEES